MHLLPVVRTRSQMAKTSSEGIWTKPLAPTLKKNTNLHSEDLRCVRLEEHHLQLNLAKTELPVFPATPTLQHDFTIQLGSSTITPSASVRYLGVIFDDQLTFKDHIATTARSCRFALHNIRKIRPFLTEHAAQLLVQALVISRLNYCKALLAGLPSCTIKHVQMILLRTQKSPCYTSLYLPALAPGCSSHQVQDT